MTEYEVRQLAIERCDNETPLWCYCGQLATGLHTNGCRKFQAKVREYAKEIQKANGQKTTSKKAD